jgi:hypothetical protein
MQVVYGAYVPTPPTAVRFAGAYPGLAPRKGPG